MLNTPSEQPSSPSRTLRLGTRGSLLARTQSQLVADQLEQRHRGLKIELLILKTSGDQIADRPLHDMGGKGLFTRELEQALLDGQVDFAVHSFKDMPTTMPLVDQSRLIVAAVPQREDPRDLLACMCCNNIANLPEGARVGTGSLRRRCQLLDRRPDLLIEPIRGNIDTRLRKLREGQFDAVILAMAGVRRAGLFDGAIMFPLDASELVPAPAQGALALQCRRDDAATIELLRAIGEPSAATCVAAERALVAHLQGDCLSPIGALATINAGQIHLTAAVGARGGNTPVIRASGQGNTPESAAAETFCALQMQNVMKLLHG
ncbi:MAG TPA: hydroxymethylbilane synthase [Humisphaera sp.]|jgi:hydroxymethylbilane synthase|nr:hydroxymethylbilane synthase [Humisphaera sp.]